MPGSPKVRAATKYTADAATTSRPGRTAESRTRITAATWTLVLT